MDVWLSIITTLILTVFNGIFSMSEMAVVNANKIRLEHDASEGDRRAKRALALSSDSGSFLATIQVAITLVGFASSAFASTNLSDPLSSWMSGFGFAPFTAIAPTLAPVIITLIVSYLSIVIGELVPKRIALSNAEGVSKSVAGFLTVFKKIAKPLVWLTSASANAISTVFHIKSADERQTVSTDEIKYMVEEQDEMSDEEKRMVRDVFDLADSKARDVMIPRVDVTTVSEDDAVGAVTRLLDMGVENFLVSSALFGVLSQRLVRKICPVCHGKMTDEAGNKCRRCNGSGYKGRCGIFELLTVDDELRAAINHNASSSELQEIAVRHGMVTLQEDGMEKVRAGITTLEELNRSTAEL